MTATTPHDRAGEPSAMTRPQPAAPAGGHHDDAPQPAVRGRRRGSGRVSLLTGGVAAIAASTCCLGPLILLALGFSGSWIATLTVLEPYRPIFLVVAVAALLIAGRRIFRPARTCTPGEVCATTRVRTVYKLLFGIVAALVVVALGFPYVMPWFY